MNTESNTTKSAAQTLSHEQIQRLLANLERALTEVQADTPGFQTLKATLNDLNRTLAQQQMDSNQVKQQLHNTHKVLNDFIASIEGELLRDTPYLAEIGRIVGLV
jgi:ABC-type transporter Mla subunit MlaD